MTTPLRRWIKNTLMKTVPVGTMWSDQDKKGNNPFELLTGLSHKDLLKKWYELDANGNLIEGTFGYDRRFTTCSSFLPRFATQVRKAGGMSLTKRNYFTGKDDPIGLKGFQLNLERGWTPAFLGYAEEGGPKEGDFFQLVSKSGMTEHVGVIVSIEGDLWSMVAGGAGGRGSKHDGVKRTPLQLKPGNVMGWLDVDVYFEGWQSDSIEALVDTPDTVKATYQGSSSYAY